MAVFGLVCIFTPLKTAFGINTMIAVLTVIYGVIGIVWSIVHKNFGIGFVFYILSAVFGVAVFFLPFLTAISNIVFARLVAGWIVLQGLVSIVCAVQLKGGKWVIQLILGVIGVMLGVYSFLHPLLFSILSAGALGVLIGGYFLQSGISVLFFSPKSEA